jgi:hypothetical protein
MTLALAVDLLKRCLFEPDPLVREELIHEFEDLVNDATDVQDDDLLDVLASAQNDLAYYEPREEWRVDRSLPKPSRRRTICRYGSVSSNVLDGAATGRRMTFTNPDCATWTSRTR